MRKLAIVITALLLWRCGEPEKEECAFIPDVSPDDVNIVFEHYADTLASIHSKSELVTFLKRHPVIRDEMLRRNEYPHDTIFVNEMFRRFTNPAIDTLVDETKRVFGDLTSLETSFQEAFANLRYYYPGFTPPKIKTLITGLDTDLFVSDSLILISLDFFLGPDARYRPKMYDYLLRRYDPEDIVPSCLLIYGISERFNRTDLTDRTVLADMVAYGKSFYFAKQLLPCTPDSVLIWYTAEEMRGARAHEDLIWARLIQDKVLFSTNMIDKKNYLGDRPATLQVGEKCPGRIAQWVGWQIVLEYMKAHPDASLPELMGFADAQTLFRESKYKPQNR